MTVYEWLTSKDDITINFDKSILGDYTEMLQIQMDIGCECSTITNSDHTLTFFPITITRTFYDDQIPNNDVSMLNILNQMHQDLMEMFNTIKYRNK